MWPAGVKPSENGDRTIQKWGFNLFLFKRFTQEGWISVCPTIWDIPKWSKTTNLPGEKWWQTETIDGTHVHVQPQMNPGSPFTWKIHIHRSRCTNAARDVASGTAARRKIAYGKKYDTSTNATKICPITRLLLDKLRMARLVFSSRRKKVCDSYFALLETNGWLVVSSHPKRSRESSQFFEDAFVIIYSSIMVREWIHQPGHST